MRLLIAAALLIAIQDSAAAGSFRCNVARGTMTTYQKEGRWENRAEHGADSTQVNSRAALDPQ